MTVYDHHYRPYRGLYTKRWSRFLILPRYSLRELFRSKLFTNIYAASFIMPLLFGAMIYFHHNLEVMKYFRISANQLMPINHHFFIIFLGVQGASAWALTLLAGPVLMTADTDNNALPLYLVRPFSLFEYLFGKFTVMMILLSGVTWVPAILLFYLQIYYAPDTWSQIHGDIPLASLLGSLILISTMSLVALAISAALKKRQAAGVALLAWPLVAHGFGSFAVFFFRADWGRLFRVTDLMGTIWGDLFNHPSVIRMPPSVAWFGVSLIMLLCVYVLVNRTKAYEVVS